MNFLAHLFLSGEQGNTKAGNLLGEFVRGTDFSPYAQAYHQGIRLHRVIDHYTDHHPVVLATVRNMYNTHHKYASVVLDIFYDYFLAKHFEDFSSVPLRDFSLLTYHQLALEKAHLPLQIQQLIEAMSTHDWLFNYGTLEGIDRSFKNLSHRARFDNQFSTACQYLINHNQALEYSFLHFFPDIITHVTLFLQNLPAGTSDSA